MISIEKQLLRRILLGQSIVWIIAAVSVWYSQRGRLYSEFDNELKFMAAALGFHLRRSNPEQEIETRWPQFNEADSGWYFQAWNEDQSVRNRSSNLEKKDETLVLEEKSKDGKLLSTEEVNRYSVICLTGPTGAPLRGIMATPVSSSSPRRHYGRENGKMMSKVLVAKSRVPLNRKLMFLAVSAAILGSLAAGATALLIRSSVRRGMGPLLKLSEDAANIDTSNLERRFDATSLPAELQPISERLNELMGRLEKGFQRERQFSSDLAHELRTPLAEIRSTQEYLLKWPEESTASHHSGVLESAVHMEEIIETLFDLSRWESGLENLALENIRIAPLVEESRSLWASKIENKNLQLLNEIPEQLELSANEKILRLIFSNLISNSVEYSPHDSVITVSYSNNGRQELIFTNEVEGFQKSDLAQMTERFWRSDESRTGESHFGLGLSIVDSCAERIGWKLHPHFDEEKDTLSMKLLISRAEN